MPIWLFMRAFTFSLRLVFFIFLAFILISLSLQPFSSICFLFRFVFTLMLFSSLTTSFILAFFCFILDIAASAIISFSFFLIRVYLSPFFQPQLFISILSSLVFAILIFEREFNAFYLFKLVLLI